MDPNRCGVWRAPNLFAVIYKDLRTLKRQLKDTAYGEELEGGPIELVHETALHQGAMAFAKREFHNI